MFFNIPTNSVPTDRPQNLRFLGENISANRTFLCDDIVCLLSQVFQQPHPNANPTLIVTPSSVSPNDILTHTGGGGRSEGGGRGYEKGGKSELHLEYC